MLAATLLRKINLHTHLIRIHVSLNSDTARRWAGLNKLHKPGGDNRTDGESYRELDNAHAACLNNRPVSSLAIIPSSCRLHSCFNFNCHFQLFNHFLMFTNFLPNLINGKLLFLVGSFFRNDENLPNVLLTQNRFKHPKNCVKFHR